MITEFKNRHRTIRYFEKVDKNTYLVWGESYYMRGSEDYIDFEGGPFIAIGTPIKEFVKKAKGIITAIEPFNRDNSLNCYKLTVE